MNFDAMHHGH